MQKQRRTIIVVITLIIVACLIASGIFVYYEYFEEEKDEKEEQEPLQEEIDDRISPTINQGLILEINRIRHRGIIEKMMKFGTSWRTPPQFYFITNIDGQEYVSKDVAATGNAQNENLFEMWDTMFHENKVVRNVEEEQETSDVTLSIVERIPTGILGLRSSDETKVTINLEYNFKTGRWSGDDHFNDSDGYGHYVNDDFEVWFNVYQTDLDADEIPYWTEVNILKTDPERDDSKLDPDADGIPTSWEWKWGYNPFVYDNHSTLDPDEDGIENIEEYKMEKYFADPYQQDIYVEVDFMEKKNIFDKEHVLPEETAQFIMERFRDHGINIYIDKGWPNGGGGDYVRYYDVISQDSGMNLQYYNNNFGDDRKGIFRYCIIANMAGFCHPAKYNRYDIFAISTDHTPLYFILSKAYTPRTHGLLLASEFMHELGHSLGIGPWNVGGNDNSTYAEGPAAKQEYLEEWGNYRSVMNYYYFFDYSVVDYSDGTHGEGDFNDWELFDLTYFQRNSAVIEDPGFELPGYEEINYDPIKMTLYASKPSII